LVESGKEATAQMDRILGDQHTYSEVIEREAKTYTQDEHPEDTIRFYALRLREAGMIKSNPNKIIAEATDWRFLNEVKRELKG
jgi:hypothetical protein